MLKPINQGTYWDSRSEVLSCVIGQSRANWLRIWLGGWRKAQVPVVFYSLFFHIRCKDRDDYAFPKNSYILTAQVINYYTII